MGAIGAVAGASLGLLGAALFAGEVTIGVVLVAVAAAAAGTAAALSTLMPTTLLRRLPTAQLLAEE